MVCIIIYNNNYLYYFEYLNFNLRVIDADIDD